MKKCNDNLLGCHGNSKKKWQPWGYGSFCSCSNCFFFYLFLTFLKVNFKCNAFDFLLQIAFV